MTKKAIEELRFWIAGSVASGCCANWDVMNECSVQAEGSNRSEDVLASVVVKITDSIIRELTK